MGTFRYTSIQTPAQHNALQQNQKEADEYRGVSVHIAVFALGSLNVQRWHRPWHAQGFRRRREMPSACRIFNSCSESTDTWSSIDERMPKKVNSFSASSR